MKNKYYKQINLIVKGGCVIEARGVPEGYEVVVCDQDEQETFTVPQTVSQEG